jgi:hypothetical protein
MTNTPTPRPQPGPRPVATSPHPLEIADPITDDVMLMEVLERMRKSLVLGSEHLDASGGYLRSLLTRYDRSIGMAQWGRGSRISHVIRPLATASDLLLDAALQIRRSATGFTRTYLDSMELPSEFKIKSQQRRG